MNLAERGSAVLLRHGPQVVDPRRRLHGDVHAAARHHDRERRAASIERDLGANFTDLQWVIDAYALTLAALLLTGGSLADRSAAGASS